MQQPLLQIAIGEADYGALARVFSVSNVFNNVLISSSTQGVSRTVAAAGTNERQALRATLRVHGIIAIVAALLLLLAAPIVAWFQHAPEVMVPLIIMAAVLGIYGVYAPLVGYINGRGMFTRQATLDIIAATVRTILFLGLGFFFARRLRSLHATPGLLGVAIGGALAALFVFLIALRWTGTGTPVASPRPIGVPDAKSYILLIVPVMVAQLFTNGLMQADIFVLGRYLSLGAISTHAPEGAANVWLGVYKACQLFAFLPYQMLFSVTQVLFPMVARARVEEPARVPELVSRGSRIGAIVCGLLVSIVVALPGSLLAFAYGTKTGLSGVATLRVLACAQACFAMIGLATTILVSLGRERLAVLLTALSLGLLVTGVTVASMNAPFGETQLVATASGAAAALALALAISVVVVKRTAGAFIPWKTALRVGLAIGIAFAIGLRAPLFGKLMTPIAAGAIGVLYLILLVVTGELGKSDLGLVLAVATRRGAKR